MLVMYALILIINMFYVFKSPESHRSCPDISILFDCLQWSNMRPVNGDTLRLSFTSLFSSISRKDQNRHNEPRMFRV